MSATNGHSYHDTSSPYLLPNDASEHDRLELQTRALNLMMHDRPISAPLKNPKRMLDVGCGTGAMVLHLARTFPDASSIIGIDLSTVPMADSDKPSNVSFVQGDFNELAASHPKLAPNSLDYIFSRMVVFGMTDWPAYIARATSLLKPGAWLELQEIDFAYYDANKNHISADWEWLNDTNKAWAHVGLDCRVGSKLEQYMRDAGLVDVQVQKFRWVFGRWEGHPETDLIGEYSPRHIYPTLNAAYRKAFSGKKSAEEIERAMEAMSRNMDFGDDGKHMPFYVVCGRKA